MLAESRITKQSQCSTSLPDNWRQHRRLRIWWPGCWRSGIPGMIGCNWNSDIQKNWWSSWERTGISTHPSTSVKDYRGRSTQFRSLPTMDRKSTEDRWRQRMMGILTASATTTELRKEWTTRHPFQIICPL